MLWNIYFSRKYVAGPWNVWQLVWVAEVSTVAQILLKKLRVLFLIEIKVSEPCHLENFTILFLPAVPRACNFHVKADTFTWSVFRCFSFKKCLRAKMPTSRGAEFLPWQFRWVHTRVLICGDRVRCEMHAAFLASWQCAQVHTWITAVDFTFFSFALFFPLSRNLVVYLGADTMHAKSLHPPYDSTLSSIPRRGLDSLRRYYSVLINVNRPTTMSRYFQPSVATPINYSNSLCLFEIKTSSVWSVVIKTPWCVQRFIATSLVYSHGLSKYVCVSVHYIQFCVTGLNSRGNFRISLGRFDFKRSSY